MASIYKLKLPNNSEYDIEDANAIHTNGGIINGSLIVNATTPTLSGHYVNINEGEIEATRTIYANEVQLTGDIDMVIGGNLNFYPTNKTSQDTGDIVYYYWNNDDSFSEKGRIYMPNNPTTVNEAAPNFRAKKADGTSLIDTKLLTRQCITAISNSVRWKTTTTTFTQVTGLSFSIPAYSVAVVTAQQLWQNAVPRAIGIGTGTGSNLVALNTNTSDDNNLGACHISTTATIINSGSSAVTYNIYCTAKTASTAGNDVKYKGIIIPYKP